MKKGAEAPLTINQTNQTKNLSNKINKTNIVI